ncbi:helix-turn-helix transcriptional regulator [Phyllobacterium sp. 0TCS1.6C]|uniref:helix-turn-helix domain-containing protein n=1 Tax=unclassified Phyllobacterium TaxID=2638441 RepID=UPI0022642457|nr:MULTISPECIES: helix-turn-helix transcriptional regulator [unclassified Phyllobacterium]MCX8282452.1 helix-turn-helix transcriptional regulator [Phyllobacterium sp. 0TCS1.6C]MCX8292544.1 helix-turn-helix transcriptional regulator [Phyllobacterium sp. 0TCS1.6A]
MRDMNTLKHIRKNIFKMTQAEFAAIAGVGQPSVSRWEKGVAPSLDEMQAIRVAAAERKIKWNDAWFFEPPKHVTECAA